MQKSGKKASQGSKDMFCVFSSVQNSGRSQRSLLFCRSQATKVFSLLFASPNNGSQHAKTRINAFEKQSFFRGKSVVDVSSFLTFWVSSCFGPHPSLPTQFYCLVIDSSEICNSTTNTSQLCSLHPRWEIECREWEEQWATRRFLGILKNHIFLGHICMQI